MKKSHWVSLLMGLMPLSAVALERKQGVENEVLRFWEISDEGISLRLQQRLPDQSRAYFLARGFSRQQVEKIATSCIFQTIFKNHSDDSSRAAKLKFDLRQWRIHYRQQTLKLAVRETWDEYWKETRVSKAARIAFEWSLLPTQQEFSPGDYNWGMTSMNLEPGSRFDLEVTWQQAGQNRSAMIHNLVCAEDIREKGEKK